MHVYQGYKQKPYSYSAGDRQPSRKELERIYAETHSQQPSSGGRKPKGDFIDKAPMLVLVAGVLMSVAAIICWVFGYDMIVPLLAMILLYEALFAFVVMS